MMNEPERALACGERSRQECTNEEIGRAESYIRPFVLGGFQGLISGASVHCVT